MIAGSRSVIASRPLTRPRPAPKKTPASAASHGLTIENVLRRYRVVHLLTLGRLADAESELGALAKAPHVEPYVELCAWLAWQRGYPRRCRSAPRLARCRNRRLSGRISDAARASCPLGAQCQRIPSHV